jgi:hypothetical protein
LMSDFQNQHYFVTLSSLQQISKVWNDIVFFFCSLLTITAENVPFKCLHHFTVSPHRQRSICKSNLPLTFLNTEVGRHNPKSPFISFRKYSKDLWNWTPSLTEKHKPFASLFPWYDLGQW